MIKKKDNIRNFDDVSKYSGVIKKITRYLVCIISSIIASLTVVYALSELQVFWYMRESHIVHRTDLGDDLGLGLLGLLLVPAFIICLLISFFIIWKLLKKINILSEKI